MGDVYKIIYPEKYYNDYISNKIRPDGRQFDEFRNVLLKVNSIKTADASAIIKIGNTSVVCGIKVELAKPKAEQPNDGFLVTNVEVPALCSSKFKPGPPSDYAQQNSKLLADIIESAKCIDLKSLCIIPDKLAWVLYCDLLCFNNDGSLIDACITSLIACLKTLKLPCVEYDEETEKITVNEDIKTSLNITGIPVASSFGIYNSETLLTDPNAYEEDMCGGIGTGLVISWNEESLCGTHYFSGSKNLPKDIEVKALQIAKQRQKIIEKVIFECIQS